jgi:hypothetical protein
MTKTTTISSHTRRLPEKAPDPFAPVLEAKRKAFASKWGVEVVSANDDGLAAPIADPVPGPGRLTLEDIAAQLKALADRAAEIGRHG